MEGHNKQLGAWGEEYAARFLIEQGYEIAQRSYRVRKAEIDIIAWRMIAGERTLCFIEVKTRTGGNTGSAERATQGKTKLQHLEIAARAYLVEHHLNVGAIPIQFEHVSVYLYGGLPRCSLYVIPF